MIYAAGSNFYTWYELIKHLNNTTGYCKVVGRL